MSKKNRVLAVLLAAAVLFVMLSSACYIAIKSDHDCADEDCPICYQISVCENTLKSVCQAVLVAIFAAFIGIFMFALPAFTKKPAHTTLVSLKVKLSN